MSEKLRECPLCGKAESVVLLDEMERLHYVCCTGKKGGCGTRTALFEMPRMAVVTWNRRAERTGLWIEEDGTQICSECGEEHEWGDYRASYCDICGAHMVGGEDDDD